MTKLDRFILVSRRSRILTNDLQSARICARSESARRLSSPASTSSCWVGWLAGWPLERRLTSRLREPRAHGGGRGQAADHPRGVPQSPAGGGDPVPGELVPRGGQRLGVGLIA